jgi:hypothetical protein
MPSPSHRPIFEYKSRSSSLRPPFTSFTSKPQSMDYKHQERTCSGKHWSVRWGNLGKVMASRGGSCHVHFPAVVTIMGHAVSSVVGKGARLQAGRSRVRFPIRSLDLIFSLDGNVEAFCCIVVLITLLFGRLVMLPGNSVSTLFAW